MTKGLSVLFEEKDAYYFSHDSNSRNDPKCVKLRRVLGMEGYGIFWVLVEMLREAKDYRLPLTAIPDIAYETRMPEEKILAVIKNFELFEFEEEMFFSVRLLRSMEVFKNRKIALSEAGKKGAQARLNQGSSEAPALKESKPNETELNVSKVNEIAVWPTFDDFWNAYDKKVDRKACEKKWEKIKQTEREKIMGHVPIYVKSTPESKYRKNPETYLNRNAWENEIIITPNGNSTGKKGFDASAAISHIYQDGK